MGDEQRTPAEERYIEEVLKKLQRLDNTDRGMFAEVVVAEALPGADLAQSWAAWDIEWGDVKIQVKCSGARQSWHKQNAPATPAQWHAPKRHHWDAETDTFSVMQDRFSDVYVLARHSGDDHRIGWTFYVLSTGLLEEIATPAGSVTLTRLTEFGIEAVEPDGLQDTVEQASKR